MKFLNGHGWPRDQVILEFGVDPDRDQKVKKWIGFQWRSGSRNKSRNSDQKTKCLGEDFCRPSPLGF